MAPETVDQIDWSHHPPAWAVPPELHVLHGVNAAYKSQDLLHQPGLDQPGPTGMPDQIDQIGLATNALPVRPLRVIE